MRICRVVIVSQSEKELMIGQFVTTDIPHMSQSLDKEKIRLSRARELGMLSSLLVIALEGAFD